MFLIDVSARMSIEQSMEHSYLIRGSGSSLTLDPRSVHMRDPPVRVATSDPDAAGPAHADDESWKRRQLSVLIAPMPSSKDYMGGVTVANAAGFYYIPGVNMYSLTPIREGKEEKDTYFL